MLSLRLITALAVLAGKADGDRTEAARIARQHGFLRGHGGGGIARELALDSLPAFNEYRGPEELAIRAGSDVHGAMLETMARDFRRNRNAAKRKRRARRASRHAHGVARAQS